MFPPSPSALLVLVLLQGAPAAEPPTVAACEDVHRVELSRALAVSSRDICVSPGLLTGFLFDVPASTELQDEVRFVEVSRGRSSISFVPPGDMLPGERLRLTAILQDGASRERLTFTLIAHRGQATRQVEVYRDRRPRESVQQEAEQERAKSQRLREENIQLRARMERMKGLGHLLATKVIGSEGVPALTITARRTGPSEGVLTITRCVSYRTNHTVAAEVWLENSTEDPWTVVGASLVDAQGQELKGMDFWQEEPILPHSTGSVIVEVDATSTQALGDLKLRLWDAELRVIILPSVRFP